MPSHTPDPSLAGPLYGQDPWPLRFHRHSFNATCHNTLACSLVYNRHQFGTRRNDRPGVIYDRRSEPAPSDGWRNEWQGGRIITPADDRTFPSVVRIEWVDMDARDHAASLDLSQVFMDRMIHHKVSYLDVKKSWLEAKSISPEVPEIMVDVDHHTVSVHMRAFVATEVEQIPGNSLSCFRRELLLAWRRTF